jgi:GTP-binding protein
MLGWFLPTGRPVHVLLTKSDKLGRAEQLRTLRGVQQTLRRVTAREATPIGVQLFSATEAQGVDEAEQAIGAWLEVRAPIGTEKKRPRHQGE